MLTFTQAQMTQLQEIWQTDQLLMAMPEVLLRLQQQFPDFWNLSTPETHQRYYCLQAEKLVNHGMGQAQHLEKLMGMEYRHQCAVSKRPWLDSALKLDWLLPEDRLELISYLFQLHQERTFSDPFPYEAFSVYPLKHRLTQIASFTPTADNDSGDLTGLLPKVLRQGLYYTLLKYTLQQQPGWQACHSDWSKAILAVRHPKLKRRVQLQTHEQEGSDHGFMLKAAPKDQSHCLYITVPPQLNEKQVETLFNYLKAWCVNLEPSSSETFRAVMTIEQNPEGATYA